MMDRPPSLCPGYRQVDAFGPDEEYEDEEEVCYVTLDMGSVEPTLVPSSTTYRLIGLDTPTPFLQLQGTVLKGRHDLLLGTELIFTDDKESHDWNKRSVIHVSNTEQRIAFQEVTLIPKASSSKGKEKATADNPVEGGEIQVDFEPPPAENRSTYIDRMTGLAGPIPRTSRKGKTPNPKTPKPKTTKKGKGKEKAKTTKGLAKGKEKEVLEPQPEEPAPMVGDPPQPPPDDDMDDMYMDIE
ncbi:hypothetical protein GALMADRAFT_126758 [Galerina marginata CBS 339.88]|uniref:Transcription factor TFIIIC triple barrel domain-containing protein n=1 Tax=Galerina marginata (strain CBS 339.88) TaxID=685588 RepID=A0A067SLP0_GALM3|nr:hypothetical protein GALMADRAFT_126758 [Galerina marginata CBS 339.88]